MEENLRAKAELMSHAAGVLGFFLAAALAVPQLLEFSSTRRLQLRLAADPDIPFAATRGAHSAPSDATFALYHDGGRELRIDAVVLRIPRKRPLQHNSRQSVVSGGFGDGGMYEIKRDATFYYLWQVNGLGEPAPPEVRSLPFTSGDTRYYSAPIAGPLGELRSTSHDSVAVTVDVWSQGRVLRSFDVTDYFRRFVRRRE